MGEENVIATEEGKKQNVANPLRNETVTFKIIERDGTWLDDINREHDGKGMFSGTSLTILSLLTDVKLGGKVDPLTEKEKKFFESDEAGLGLGKGDLSINKKTDNFWKHYCVRIPKEGLKLDLNFADNYIKYKFLLSHRDIIAPSWEERFGSALYKFAVKSEIYEQEQTLNKAGKLKEAYINFSKIENSVEKMSNILRLCGKKVSVDSSIDFMKSEIQKIIETKIDEFNAICKDKDFDLKVFIEKAVAIGEIKKLKGGFYSLHGGDNIGNLNEAIDFFKNKANTDIRLTLEARIQAAIG